MAVVPLLTAVVVGYLLGAIPSGVLVGRLRGIDPRAAGSGRTGATNALRTVGPAGAALVLALDVAKGALAVVLGAWLASSLGGEEAWAGALAGVGAVIGHIRSVFIGFTGGRGVATGAGAMLILAPLAVAVAIPVLVAAVWGTRYVSLGSILAAITVALGTVALGWFRVVGGEAVLAASLIGAIVVVAHADNIRRLRSGSERRLGSG